MNATETHDSLDIAPRRALLVEDDTLMRGLMATYATMLGVRPQEFESGEEALAYLASTRPTERPDVVLLDVDLPGMDGVAVCERLAAEELYPLGNVVIVSGTATSEEVARARSLGVTKFLRKPFQLDELRRMLVPPS